jgi:hypothetical protein
MSALEILDRLKHLTNPAAAGHQLVVAARLDDAAGLQDDDKVGRRGDPISGRRRPRRSWGPPA